MPLPRIINILAPVSFRGKARLLHHLCPREGEREADVFGYRVHLDLQDFIQRSIYLRTFEPSESRTVVRYLKPGMTVVDAGANVGYYSLLAASVVGSTGHVYAFEPAPYVADKFQRTVSDNQIANVTIERAALGERNGVAVLNVPATFQNYTPHMIPSPDSEHVDVPIATLDDYALRHNIQRIDLLKMDVEGYEPNIIEGASRLLRENRIRAVLCELNRFWLECNGSSPERLLDSLRGRGLEVTGEPFAPAKDIQNLLLVSFVSP